jgi:hypothetical protein
MGSDAGAIERATGRDVLIGDGSRFHAQSPDASTWVKEHANLILKNIKNILIHLIYI